MNSSLSTTCNSTPRYNTWFKVLWESPESASYNSAFRALKASFGKAENEPLTCWVRVLSFYRVGTGR